MNAASASPQARYAGSPGCKPSLAIVAPLSVSGIRTHDTSLTP